MKILLAAVLAFAISAIAGKIVIPMLRRMKAKQSIKTDGPTWHMSKDGTPTMGGIIFIIGIIVAFFVCSWEHLLAGQWGGLMVLLFALVFGAIGYVDDYEKVKKKQNTGLTAGRKFLLQLAVAVAFTVLLRYTGHLTPNLYVPFLHVNILLPWSVYMVFAAFVMVGTVNAVNLTDGVDGLATTVTMPVAAFFATVSAFGVYRWQRPEHETLAVFSAALFGGLVGFLIYNYHPAKVFMGDTGALFLGGAVCGLAFALDMPLILILVGIVYIAETLSDILQVAYFRATHGKRIFRMAPLHHHFEMGGWSEEKLCAVFSGVTVVMCLLAFWGMIGRVPVL